MAKYARNTHVGIARSREAIDRLLRQWNCESIQWTDEFISGIVTLRFNWRHDDALYNARIELKLGTDESLRALAKDGRSGQFSESKFRKLQQERGQQEHRVLLLWIKAAFNAVEAGIVTAEMLFLPFLEGADGRTVAEVALPRMRNLLTSKSAVALLNTRNE